MSSITNNKLPFYSDFILVRLDCSGVVFLEFFLMTTRVLAELETVLKSQNMAMDV